jgi:ankyrin repeat protein
MNIFEAAWKGNLQIVKEFIEKGVDINAKDIDYYKSIWTHRNS